MKARVFGGLLDIYGYPIEDGDRCTLMTVTTLRNPDVHTNQIKHSLYIKAITNNTFFISKDYKLY
jgi:hypothetical protein